MASHLLRAQWLEGKVSGVGRHSEDTESVGVTEATLPSLDRNDGRSGSDNAQLKRISQAKANAVVHLAESVSKDAGSEIICICSHQFAIGAPGFLEARGTRMDNNRGASGFDATFVGCG